MANLFKLSRDQRDNWRRQNLGRRIVDGDIKPATFFLGRDHNTACQRVVLLEKMWEHVERDWQKDRTTAVPLWTAETYAIALAVARGESPIYLDIPAEDKATAANYPDPDTVYAVWIGSVRELFPFLDLRVNDSEADKIEQAGADVSARLEQQAEAMRETARCFRGAAGGEMLHTALDAYGHYLHERYGGSGYGRTQVNLKTLLKSQLPNFALSTLTADKIDTLLAHFSNRPLSKHDGKPLAYYTVRNALITLRQFLRWLDRSEQFKWQMPRAFYFPRQKIKKLPPDRVPKRRTFLRSELRILWEYAPPWERALILLALNCGMSKAEIATLQAEEVVKDDRGRAFIKRHRPKTGVYGEWILWEETEQALRFLRTFHRGGTPYIVTSKTGKPLDTPTKGGNENQTIKNHWDRLIKRIRADYPEFPTLPFKCLKKTGTTAIRKKLAPKRDTELASMYIAHGEASDSPDQLLRHYADRPWAKLHRVLRRLRRYLSPMFETVAEPWIRRPTRISPLKLQRMRAMRQDGMTLQQIAEEVGLHWVTVGKYLRMAEV